MGIAKQISFGNSTYYLEDRERAAAAAALNANPIKYGKDIGSMYAAQAAAGTILTNTTDETALSTATIGAGSLKAGTAIHVFGQGLVIDNNGSDTLTIRLNLAGTAIATTAALNPDDNDIYIVDGWITIRTVGASGTYVATGNTYMNLLGADRLGFYKTSTAIDTTAAIALTISGEWNSAHTDNEVRSDIFNVVIY